MYDTHINSSPGDTTHRYQQNKSCVKRVMTHQRRIQRRQQQQQRQDQQLFYALFILSCFISTSLLLLKAKSIVMQQSSTATITVTAFTTILKQTYRTIYVHRYQQQDVPFLYHRKSDVNKPRSSRRWITLHTATSNDPKEPQQDSQLLFQMQSDYSTSSSLSVTSRGDTKSSTNTSRRNKQFDLSVALLCSGLAFDAYVEPDSDSSRWERGSSGVNVAFCSVPYTRSLYRGYIELQIHKVTNLPSSNENDSTAERIISGDGIDAYVLATIVEGQWKDDIATLEKNDYMSPNGISDMITGAAHVSRTSTCWSTITREKAELAYRKRGTMLPYHIPKPPSSLLDVFSKKDDEDLGIQAIWPKESKEPSIYLYVQDPSKARLVLTVMDDDRIVLGGSNNNNYSNETKNIEMNQNGRPIGLTYKTLKDMIPQVQWSTTQFVNEIKRRVVQDIQKEQLQRNDNPKNIDEIIQQKIQEQLMNNTMNFVWTGRIPLLRKPRKLDKGNQRWVGAAVGAAIAGPIGAAAGTVLANYIETPISGQIHCTIKYTPLPPPSLLSSSSSSSDEPTAITTKSKSNQRNTYIVKGGTPGVDWGSLYTKYQLKQQQQQETTDDPLSVKSSSFNEYRGKMSDLEHCFFVTHKKTGATCAVYRSLQHKYIVVSFRGTCAPIDLITDASLIQETWIEGEDENIQLLPKVHVGFRSSMNSISRRLKELLLAVPAPGDTIDQYDMYVTGHSLGGALSTLFTADIGQYGIDAGRGLPQLEQSEPWWKSIASTIMGSKNDLTSDIDYMKGPPRPKSLRMYNFGSPRVGNMAFAELFDALVAEGQITDAYRIVNGDDVVARLPRSVNALVFGNINYEHVGTTVLLSDDSNINSENNNDKSDDSYNSEKINWKDTYLWIEGESDDSKCPVRDGEMLISPMAEGTLLNDLITATREGFASVTPTTTSNSNIDETSNVGILDRLSYMAGKVTDRVKNIKASDIASIIGIDQSFTDRELRIIQSLLQGNALAHHLEDQYYAGMGRASGFVTRLNEDIVELPSTTSASSLESS